MARRRIYGRYREDGVWDVGIEEVDEAAQQDVKAGKIAKKLVATETDFRKAEGGVDYANFPKNPSYVAASDVRAAYAQGNERGYEDGFMKGCDLGHAEAREQAQDFIMGLEEENDRLLGENARLSEENAALQSQLEAMQIENLSVNGSYRHIN